jgi:hypothetical protein
VLLRVASCFAQLPQHEERRGGYEDAHSKTGRASPIWGAGGVRTGGDRSHGPRGSGGGRHSGWRLGDRRSSDPGTRGEARQDRAPQHRGARGRKAACEGAGRRAGANSKPTRIGVALLACPISALLCSGDTRTHMGCSLAEGDLEETTLTCRCHGSQFDVSSGAVLRGPAQEPVKTHKTREEGGNLVIES